MGDGDGRNASVEAHPTPGVRAYPGQTDQGGHAAHRASTEQHNEHLAMGHVLRTVRIGQGSAGTRRMCQVIQYVDGVIRPLSCQGAVRDGPVAVWRSLRVPMPGIS